MRSITVKLLLAFLVISMLSVVLIVLSARWVTEREFRSFLFDQNRTSIVTGLAEFYSKNGSWAGVENATLIPGQAQPPRFAAGNERFFTLVDKTNRVLLAGPGDQLGEVLPKTATQNGIPIKVNGQTVGSLLTRQPSINVNRPKRPSWTGSSKSIP